MEKINFVNFGEPDLCAENLNQMQTNIENAFAEIKLEIKKETYPIGKPYISFTDPTNPSEILGFGTWERLKDTFIYALGDEGNVGDTGGSETHKHTQASTTGSTTLTGAQSGVQAHSHAFSTGGSALVVNANSSHYGLPKESGFVSSTATWFSDNNKNVANISNATAKNATQGHTHTLGSTNEANSMPPYTKAYIWIRTA